MATDLNVAQLLEISKVEGLDEKAVLQSIGSIVHGETNADASYVFVDDPSVPLPDQSDLTLNFNHRIQQNDILASGIIPVLQGARIVDSEEDKVLDPPQSDLQRVDQPKLVSDVPLQENTEPLLHQSKDQKVEEEEKPPQVVPTVEPEIVDTDITEANSNQPGPGEAFDSDLQPSTRAQVKLNQDKSVSDVSVLEDMDIGKADSNQPHPGDEKTEEENKLPQVVESDLHTFTHGEDKLDQDKSVSDVKEEEIKEPVNEGTHISEADSNQFDPKEEKVKEEKQLPQVVEVLESDSHRLTPDEEKADQEKSASDVIVEVNREPVIETTGVSEVDSNHPNLEEKVKEKKQLLEVEAVKSDSHRLTHGEEKADQDKSVSDVIVEENREPVIEMTDSEVDSNHPNLEEKVEEEKKLPQVAETVKSDLHQLTHGKEKVNQDKSVPDVIVEEHKEPVIGSMDIVEPETNQPSPEEEKVEVEVEKKVPEVVEAVESDLHQLAHGEVKVDDQAKFDCESESIGSQVLISQNDVTDSVDKSELHQPYDGDNKVGEINEVGAHIEAQENSSSQFPIAEACESQPLQVCIEEETGEQSKLESFVDVCQDTQISTREAVESEPSRPDNVKECNTGTLLDEIPVGEPSTHLEAENLESDMVTCPSVDSQVEIKAKSSTDKVIGDLTTSAVEQAVLEAEISNASAEDQKKSSTCTIGQNESEPQNVNGHVQNTENSVSELKSETDVEDVSAESGEGFSSSCDACVDLEPEAAEVFVEGHESKSSAEDLKSEAELGNGPVEGNSSTEAITSHDLDRETNGTNGFTGSTNLSADPVDYAQSKSGEGNSSPESLKLPTTDTAKLESLISNGPGVNGESNPNSINNVKSIEIEGVCADSNGKSTCEGNGIEEIGINGSPSPSPEYSAIGSLEGASVDSEVAKKPFRFLIRIPRYNDDTIKNQIDLAQKKVEEKTRNRDAIRSTIQSRRATCGEYRDTFEAARSEERVARDALNAKRREMDSVQSVISRKKNANSVEDIDDRIRIMEHRIEHETVPLKEEKQLIREIKQMKNLREQLSSSLGQQAELEPTSDERVKLEERHRPLKQEIEQCRREVSRLEGITKAAWKIYFDENEKLKELQAQFRAADDLRQEAYIELQNLKRQLYEKNKYFRMYKEDAWKAEDYSCKGDREALHNLCVNQVERIMELWNKNDEFRNEYIRCNTMSTLRRLRTLDGRSLGPDEEPPLLRNSLDERVDNSLVGSGNKIEFPSLSSSQGKSVAQDMVSVENLEQKNHKVDSKSVLYLEQKNLKADSKSVLNLEQIYPIAKSQKITKSAGLENIPKTVSGSDEKQDNAEENKQATEEEILARKTEELRKEKEAAKLKEQRRLEEKAKAKEAEERKKRNAVKAQARAELRAQKEAEIREKEKEKKARKKERKMAEATTVGNETESSSRSESTQPETTQEPEIKEKPKTVGKRPQKPSMLAKQIKPKVVPPPLRNRSKKRMQQWMWILLVVVVVTALFLFGNIGFSKFGLSSFSF